MLLTTSCGNRLGEGADEHLAVACSSQLNKHYKCCGRILDMRATLTETAWATAPAPFVFAPHRSGSRPVVYCMCACRRCMRKHAGIKQGMGVAIHRGLGSPCRNIGHSVGDRRVGIWFVSVRLLSKGAG